MLPPLTATYVLAVGVDQLTLGRVSTAVRGTEFSLHCVSALEVSDRVAAAEAPTIVLIEWGAQIAEQARLCEAIRRSAAKHPVHLVAVGGPADHDALLKATEALVDDALTRPFDGWLLLFRLRRAARAMRTKETVRDPRTALSEARRHGSGEVCVRAGDTVARIHVQSGHIVWATLSSAPVTMEEIVARSGVAIDEDLMQALKHECRMTGAQFMDVLVQWGMIDRERARETLRAFVCEQVERVLDLRDAVALFLPRSRPRQQSDILAFDAAQSTRLATPPERSDANVETAGEESRRVLTATSAEDLVALVETVMRTDGAVSAAILERGTGTCLLQAGASLDTAVAWSQVAALSALGPSAVEMLASTRELHFVTRALRRNADLMIFTAFESRAISVGLARAAVAAVAARDLGSAGAAGSRLVGDMSHGGNPTGDE